MTAQHNTLKALALAGSVLLCGGCSLFKKPCDCPKWDHVPTPERSYDVHGAVPAPVPPPIADRS